MSRVDLNKVEIGFSPITEEVYIGTLTKTGLWNTKIPFKNKFLDCIIKLWEGKTKTVKSGSSVWEITVKKIKD